MVAVASTSSARPVPAGPAAPDPLRHLTADELRAYDANGFVVVPDVFPASELETIDREIDRLLTIPGNDAGGFKPGWIMSVGSRSEITGRFARDERLLALIEDIVQPGIAIHSTKLVTKLPYSDDICHWHQDDAFYINPKDPDTFSRTRMSVWVPLQDAHERNGCLWVVPGSHKWGIDEWITVDWGTCRRKITREEYASAHCIPVPVRAGSVVLFHAMTWHHSKNNWTDRVRRAFIVSYQEATVPKGAGKQWRILRPAPGMTLPAVDEGATGATDPPAAS